MFDLVQKTTQVTTRLNTTQHIITRLQHDTTRDKTSTIRDNTSTTQGNTSTTRVQDKLFLCSFGLFISSLHSCSLAY